jgi:ubiquinone/menaquinone biosynthesis C-methylase UbiE
MFLLAEKGKQSFDEIEDLGARYQPIKTDALLEIGCGTGGFLVAAKSRFKHVVGTDIAFRWLVIARKRLEELGLEVPLVCCCSEYLPFRDDSFDLTVAEDVLEHVREQEATLRETHRVLNSEGMLFIGTPNRFSITSEPHVRVWGVGFLPRRWMDRYVKLIKGISYEHIKVLSFPELKVLLKKSRFDDHHILLPTITEEELRDFSKFEKAQVALYELVKRIPVARNVLLLFGPFFHILCYAHKNRENQPVS